MLQTQGPATRVVEKQKTFPLTLSDFGDKSLVDIVGDNGLLKKLNTQATKALKLLIQQNFHKVENKHDKYLGCSGSITLMPYINYPDQ